MLSNVFQIISSRTSSYFLRDSFSHEEEALISKSCTFERAAPTAADPKETLSPKRVVGNSENRAVVGAVSSFGLRKCRWGALGTPKSGPGSPVPHPWPERSAICRIPCISAVQGHGPPPHGSPSPPPPLYCFLSFLPPCFDQLAARRTWGSADSRRLRPLPPTPRDKLSP